MHCNKATITRIDTDDKVSWSIKQTQGRKSESIFGKLLSTKKLHSTNCTTTDFADLLFAQYTWTKQTALF